MAHRMRTDEERCLLLPSTLSSGALNWYCRLPPETVDSFEELRKLLKLDESLREYAGRFSHEYSRCAEADDKTTLKAFR
ncbi:hypothetical protein ACFX2I_034752 [Malus domestica]